MELLKIVKDSLDKVSSSNIKVYDMKNRSPLFDYIVIATVDVVRQSNSVINYIETDIKRVNGNIKSISGSNTDWVLLDLSDVIVHIFTYEQRAHYDLDRLFLEIPQINIEDIK